MSVSHGIALGMAVLVAFLLADGLRWLLHHLKRGGR